ncbi:MAG: hypothetical protein EOO96_10145 [Pedobacter sp.]|nr:MAG: hypothetical protein EOO96_10145 [Pedobacter sp.]
MRNFAIAVILIVLTGCRNTSNETNEKNIPDTIKTKADGVALTKQDSIPVKKIVKKDTIRNYKDTQMSEEFFQKAIIDLSDSSLTVYQNIRADYRIFGYQLPDTNSRKMIFFSVFTPDVENNPYNCPYGSYYYSGAMQDTQIKYIKNSGAFVKTHLIKDKNTLLATIYFLKDWIQFEERN